MNKQQIKGSAKDMAGKAQREAGDLMDSPSQEAKGVAKQISGKAEKALGNAKEALRGSSDRVSERASSTPRSGRT